MYEYKVITNKSVKKLQIEYNKTYNKEVNDKILEIDIKKNTKRVCFNDDVICYSYSYKRIFVTVKFPSIFKLK